MGAGRRLHSAQCAGAEHAQAARARVRGSHEPLETTIRRSLDQTQVTSLSQGVVQAGSIVFKHQGRTLLYLISQNFSIVGSSYVQEGCVSSSTHISIPAAGDRRAAIRSCPYVPDLLRPPQAWGTAAHKPGRPQPTSRDEPWEGTGILRAEPGRSLPGAPCSLPRHGQSLPRVHLKDPPGEKTADALRSHLSEPGRSVKPGEHRDRAVRNVTNAAC